MAKNRTCYLCGKTYDYCPSCDRDKSKPTWYFAFCSEKCHDLDYILSQNTAGKLSIVDTQDKLKKINFNKDDILIKDVKNHIEKIMSYKEKVGSKSTEIKK